MEGFVRRLVRNVFLFLLLVYFLIHSGIIVIHVDVNPSKIKDTIKTTGEKLAQIAKPSDKDDEVQN